jgi:hypothetical protein
MEVKVGKTAIDVAGDVPLGTHFCQFCQTKEDLTDLLIPYFKAGPENNEFCMPVTSEASSPKEAKEPLEKQVREPDDHIAKGRMKIN